MGRKRRSERLGGDVEAAQTIVVGLGKVSNFDCFANKTEAYGTSHCIMSEVTLDAVVSFGRWWRSCCFLVDWIITDMVSVRRNAGSLPRQSATLVLAKSANI
jgi:hypothetical protein